PAMTIQAPNTTTSQPLVTNRHMSSPLRGDDASLISRTITTREILAIPLTISTLETGSEKILTRVIISHKTRASKNYIIPLRLGQHAHRRNHVVSDRRSGV